MFFEKGESVLNRFAIISLFVSAVFSLSYAAEFSQVRPSAEEQLQLPTEDWLTNGGDLFNRNFSSLDEIDRSNVNELRPIWRSHLNGSGLQTKYSGEAQAIVHEGVMFIITGADDVFALSLDSGEILWNTEANLTDEISTICCGWTSRGVGFGEDKILLGSSMGF